MKALGFAALLLALVMIFLPVLGGYGTIPVGVLAALACGGGFNLGLAAIVINVVNILFLSPYLYMAKNAGLSHGDHRPLYILIGLVCFQGVCAAILVLVQRRLRPSTQGSRAVR